MDTTESAGSAGAGETPRVPAVRPTRMDRRGVFAWCLYDWANSPFTPIVTTFVFAAYFANNVADDTSQGESQWAFIQGTAALGVAVLSPVLGAIADHAGRRKPWILVLTLIMALACAALWFAEPRTDDSAGGALVLLVAVAVATVASELAVVVYNAMLPTIVPEPYLGRVSGWAWGLGYAGGLACLLIVLFGFVLVDTPPFGLDPETSQQVRIGGPIVAVWTILFTVPLLLWTPDITRPGKPFRVAVVTGMRQLRRTIAEARRYRHVARFLIAHLLYMDGLNTLFALGGVYAAVVFGMDIAEVIMFGMAIQVTAGLGAVAFAWVDDRFGAKPTILIGLAALVVAAVPILITESRLVFWIFGCAAGVFFGPVQAASRSLMARLVPPGMETEMFGLFALSGKATAFIGPWLVGLVIVATESQRWGMATVGPFVVVGGIMLWFVPTKQVDPDTIGT